MHDLPYTINGKSFLTFQKHMIHQENFYLVGVLSLLK